MYDVIVIGAGVSGQAAAVTAVKKQLSVFVVTERVLEISGTFEPYSNVGELYKNFSETLAQNPKTFILHTKTLVTVMEKNIVSLSVEDHAGILYYGRAIIMASGMNKAQPNTIYDSLTQKTAEGYVKVDAAMRTNISGIFAAGEIIAQQYCDPYLALGQGIQAAVSVYNYINKKVL